MKNRKLCLCGCGEITMGLRGYRRNHDANRAANQRANQRARAHEHYMLYHEAKLKEHREWREQNREQILKQRRTYTKTPEGRAQIVKYSSKYWAKPANRMRLLINGARLRSKEHGWPFDESLSSLIENAPSACACCGRELDYSMFRGRNNRDASPSLDRFHPAKGYVPSNVDVLCWRCNHIKTDATLEEMETLVRYMKIRSRIKEAA